jgi:hypothetical protein
MFERFIVAIMYLITCAYTMKPFISDFMAAVCAYALT